MENREGVPVDELCKTLRDNQVDNLCPRLTYIVSVAACEGDKLWANFLQRCNTVTD